MEKYLKTWSVSNLLIKNDSNASSRNYETVLHTIMSFKALKIDVINNSQMQHYIKLCKEVVYYVLSVSVLYQFKYDEAFVVGTP